LECAQALDAQDKIAHLRNEFLIPVIDGKEAIYFLGNSLGLQPKRTATSIEAVLTQWSRYGVEAFFQGAQPWLSFHDNLVQQLSLIVGALPQEVVVMNQLTVNLHLMLASFYQPTGTKTKILCEAKAFPSDQYMLETHLRHRGLDPDSQLIEVAPRAGESCIRQEDILQAIEQHKNELALVLWGGVNYYTGQVFDIEAITAAAHASGILAGFDLAHAAGNVPLQLHDWNVDFACWCNYKYLNAGPGAVGAAFIHERFHNDAHLPRLAGWWGYKKDTRFQMQKGFVPVASAEGWALSTPSPILFAALKASLELFEQAGMEQIRQKGAQLTDFLFFVLDGVLKKFETPPFVLLTPRNRGEHGCQVSILFAEKGKAVFENVAANHVFADWREPNVIRIAPVPLYNTFEDVWRFGNIIETALLNSLHQH